MYKQPPPRVRLAAFCLDLTILVALGIVVGVGTAVIPGVIKKDTNAKNAGAATAPPTNLATVWLMSLFASP